MKLFHVSISLGFAFLGWFSTAQEVPLEVQVKYLSADRVYLEGGKDDGIHEGDRFEIRRDGRVTAVLEVAYTSGKSASCRVISQTEDVEVGAIAIRSLVAEKESSVPAETAETRRRETATVDTARGEKRAGRTSGRVAIQYYSFINDDSEGRDYSQPAFRINLRGRDLLDGKVDFRVRTRTRYTIRDLPDSSRLEETEWNNRIYEASLTYQKPGQPIRLRFGRLASSQFSGVGYIDGAMAQWVRSERHAFGLFAGVQPEWQHTDVSTDIQKYGLSYGFDHDSGDHSRFRSNWALVGEYHGSEINREFAYLQNSYHNRKLYLHQSAEIELNRDWRKDRAGSSVELSNLFATIQYRAHPRLSIGLSYDDRQNYYTFELLNRDELFFDQLSRQGYRANVQLKLPASTFVNANYGYRKREGDEDHTTSYYANIYKNNLFAQGWTVNLRVNGYDNLYSSGTNAALRLGRRFRSGTSVHVEYANYDYDLDASGDSRNNAWIKLESYVILGKRLSATAHLEQNSGDDAEGIRIFLEFGYRL